MYTQCPDCGTVFRVTAEVLRAAQGAVRCGICSTSFNALEALRDEPRALLDIVAPEDTITVEEMPGNELIELSSTDAEAANGPTIGEPDLAQAAGEAAAVEAGDWEDVAEGETPGELQDAGQAPAAAAEYLDWALDDAGPEGDRQATPSAASGRDEDAVAPGPVEEELEFHGSAEDAERLFVLDDSPSGERPLPQWQRPVEPGAEDALLEAIERVSESDLSGIEVREEFAYADHAAKFGDLDSTDEFPILVLDERDAEQEARLAEDEAKPAERARPPSGAGAASPGVDDEAAVASPGEEPRFLIPEAMRRDLASGTPPSEADLGLGASDSLGLPSGDLDEETPRRWPWLAVAALLLAAVGAQAVHFWRDDLARHPVAGPWVIRAYQALGLPIGMPTDLAAFELRQWGATSDPTQASRLRLRASIVNRAVFAQPYPLLRLSLQDRFGNTIGVRDVEPADYLPGGAAVGGTLLGAGQRADAEIVFVDPGRDAVGFEVDLCLPAGGGLRCANAAAP